MHYTFLISLQVKFVTPISILDHPKINEWLGLVEKQMRITLAASLAQAVEDVKVFHTTSIDVSAFMEWVDKYQVCMQASSYVCLKSSV